MNFQGHFLFFLGGVGGEEGWVSLLQLGCGVPARSTCWCICVTQESD